MTEDVDTAMAKCKQIELKAKIMHVTGKPDLREMWDEELRRLRRTHGLGDEDGCKESIRELYGIIAYADKADRKI